MAEMRLPGSGVFSYRRGSFHFERAWGAGAAYAVDTAEVSEIGACKVESWVSLANNHDFFAAVAPACVMNLSRPVEVSCN